MVGIHALSIPKFVDETKANRNGALLDPTTGRRRLFNAADRVLEWARSCVQRFATSLAFGDVFEAPGCPHKVADTRVNFTTDR
jgi:hypothetical protein